MTRATAFVVAGATAVAIATTRSSPPPVHSLTICAAAVFGVVAVLAGRRRYCPRGLAWRALTLSMVLTMIATLVSHAPVFAGADFPLPQPGLPDAGWLSSELLMAGALGLALARRERRLMVVLDLVSIVVCVGLIVGVTVVEPALVDGQAALGRRLCQVAYVACDIALIACMARVVLAPRGRPPALWILCAASACTVIPDIVWTNALTAGEPTFGFWPDFGWGVFPLVVGLAALHPSMARLGADGRRIDAELHPTTPLLLGLTTVIAPVFLGAHAFVDAVPDIDDSRLNSGALMIGGAILAALVVARFVLLIRRARGRADRSEARYQTLVEQVPAVVVQFRLSADGSDPPPVYVSPQAEAIVGLRPEDWLADPARFASMINPDDLEMLKARLDDHGPGESSMHPEFRVRRPDGEEIWLRDVAGVVTAEASGAGYLHSMLVDITESKHAEAERERMEGELRLAQKLEAVGQLAAGIAHEINTPTQFVGDTIRFLEDAFADLLELVDAYATLADAATSGIVDAALLERIREAEEQADLEYLRERIPGAFMRGADGVSRVARIVRAMRDFAHPPTLEKAPVDVVAALQDTLIMTGNTYKYVAEVETEFDELPAIIANGGELNQIFLNLVVNAAHAIESVVGDTGRRGTIRLGAHADGDHVLISVSDTGCGIPDAVAARVFDPFFTTKEVGRGTGQGLALARKMVVESHGGTLTFESEPGQGTTFNVRLPIGERDAVAA